MYNIYVYTFSFDFPNFPNSRTSIWLLFPDFPYRAMYGKFETPSEHQSVMNRLVKFDFSNIR